MSLVWVGSWWRGGPDLTTAAIAQALHRCERCAGIKRVKPLWYKGWRLRYHEVDTSRLIISHQGQRHALPAVPPTTGGQTHGFGTRDAAARQGCSPRPPRPRWFLCEAIPLYFVQVSVPMGAAPSSCPPTGAGAGCRSPQSIPRVSGRPTPVERCSRWL